MVVWLVGRRGRVWVLICRAGWEDGGGSERHGARHRGDMADGRWRGRAGRAGGAAHREAAVGLGAHGVQLDQLLVHGQAL